MKLVILESPYSADTPAGVELNVDYARRCIRDCLARGESPIASHLLFTQPNVLDDTVPDERRRGIEAGLAWIERADYSVYYTDRGWSSGMLSALHTYSVQKGFDFRIRALDKEPILPATLHVEVEELLKKAVEK